MTLDDFKKQKYNEWIEHFLLDGIEVEKFEGSDKYVIGTRDTDHIHFSEELDDEGNVVKGFCDINFERHRFIQTDPVKYQSAESAWAKALYEARNNTAKFYYARSQASEAMRHNRQNYEQDYAIYSNK